MIGMPDAAAQDAAKDQQGQKAGGKPANTWGREDLDVGQNRRPRGPQMLV